MTLQTRQIETYLPDLKRYARSLCHNEDDACDLVQDCVERALVKRELFRRGTNLRSWLFTLMRNVFISHKRREMVARRHLQQVALTETGVARPNQTHRVFLTQTLAAIERLSKAEGSALKLLGIEERTHQDAAARARLPVGTMKSRLSRGRASLRVVMGEVA